MLSYKLYSSFFVIAGAFVLLMIVILIALLIKHKDVGKSATFSNLRNFILCFFCVILLYYYESFMGMYTGVFERGVLSRVADFTLVILIQYFWYSFVRVHLYTNCCEKPIFDKAVIWILGILLVVSNFNCIALMDANFFVANEMARIFAIVIELTLCIVCCGLNVYCIVASMKAKLKKDTLTFTVAVSLLLFCNGLFNEVVTIRLISGKMSYIVESFYYDPTSLVMLCTAVCTLIYLFKHDFSPIYFMEHGAEEISDEEVLDQLSAEYGLSKRETEIAKLIFDGDSYEDIAEKLFISKLTVKKHAHNLYEKLDVGKRMDLINLVREHKSSILPK